MLKSYICTVQFASMKTTSCEVSVTGIAHLSWVFQNFEGVFLDFFPLYSLSSDFSEEVHIVIPKAWRS